MRNPNRLDSFYNELHDLHKKYLPDLRFGQMIYNFIAKTGDPFYLEEDEFMKQFKVWLSSVVGKDIE